MSRKKAVSFDGFSDKWINETEKWYLLNDWWNNTTM